MLGKMMAFRNLKNLAWIRDSAKVSDCLVFALFFMLVTTMPVQANNLMVENAAFTDRNTAEHYGKIRFDISWDNSWRTSEAPANWDAAWVFAKWKFKNGTGWSHCTLSTADDDHSAPAGSQIDASFTRDNNGKGIFIYRNSDGKGSNDWNGIELRWNYIKDNVPDDAVVDVNVFAIEMVYVPEGNFFLGDGASTFTFYDNDKGSTTPAHITYGSVSVNAETHMIRGPLPVDGDDGLSGNADYPTGYKAFYCMKYEISQGQYADFLNTLTPTQDKNRFSDNKGKFRNTIGGSAGSRSAGAKDRACNYLSVADGVAYVDWSGLRPMTELEFEKACRGPLNYVAGEYAWGSENIAQKPYTLKNDGQRDEAIATNYATAPFGNAAYSKTERFIRGPLRGGIFATGTSSRAEAGATYYGIMEMSGNLEEKPVTLANPAGRRFKGTHGDGMLTKDGFADIADWPGYEDNKNKGAAGFCSRGGAWNTFATTLHVSGRQKAGFTVVFGQGSSGFRGVRSAW